MAEPFIYTPTYSYSGYQASNPTRPLPAPKVDNDFAKISQSTSEIALALRDIRRSDGKLQNGLVTIASLESSLSALIAAVPGLAAAAAVSAASAATSAGSAAVSAAAAEGSANVATAAAQRALENATGLVIATQAQAEAGVLNDKGMTPLRTRQQVDQRVLTNVRTMMSFNPVADGITDDRLVLQSAFDWLRAAPGRTLIFPNNKRFAHNGRIVTDDLRDAKIFFNGSSFVPLSADRALSCTPQINVNEFRHAPVLDMAGNYLAGATAITLTAPSDAAAFTPGAFIWISSRSAVTPGLFPGQGAFPIAELNKVKSANPTTGVIEFQYPLAKDYIRDTVTIDPDTGTFYRHGVTVATGGARVFAENVLIDGLNMEYAEGLGGGFGLYFCQVWNLTIQNCKAVGPNLFVVRGRFVRIIDNDLTIKVDSGISVADYGIAPDTGSSDYWICRNTITNRDGLAYLHLHEGLANFYVSENTLMSTKDIPKHANYPSQFGAINVAGTSWNMNIRDNTIVNACDDTGGAMYGIRVTGGHDRVSSGGVAGLNKSLSIVGNRFRGAFPTYILVVEQGADNALVAFNDFSEAQSPHLFINCQIAFGIVVDNTGCPEGKLGSTINGGVLSRRLAIRNPGNDRIIAESSSNSPGGASLIQTATGVNSPRLRFENVPDNKAVTLYQDTGKLVIGTGGAAGGNNGTSGQTAMQVDDLTAGSYLSDGNSALLIALRISGATVLKRVLIGSADSGGVGFRMLRITN